MKKILSLILVIGLVAGMSSCYWSPFWGGGGHEHRR
jgi:hypothetical protein